MQIWRQASSLTRRRKQTNTKPSKESTRHKQRNGRGGRLQGDAEAEDKALEDHGDATAKEIGHRGGGQGAKEGSCRQQGDNLGRLRRGHVGQAVGGIDVAGREETAPVFHGQDAADGAGVISRIVSRALLSGLSKAGYSPKEHTSKGHKAANEDGRGCRPDGIVGLLEHEAHYSCTGSLYIG